ncbi:MAG TPA: methionyl-tRNA formyltransferase [Candidatus Binatia bacterium]|nr:methionyl-tRNA formyltransferase [Candidatus Binatia bacterium]
MPPTWPMVFMGTPATAVATLEQLLRGPDRIVGVVTQPDRPTGRGQKTAPSPVRRVAETHGIPTVAPEKIRDPQFLDTLRNWHPEIIVVVAYGRILPKAILELAPHGCLNVHYSLLPKCRGAAPAAWTIINGEPKAGVTTMRLVEKMDAGPVYLQETLAVASDETTGSLQTKLTPIGSRLLLETLRQLKEDRLQPHEQDESAVTFAPLLKKEDGLIDWNQSAVAIERRVRGFDPWPGAYTHIGNKLLKIHRAKVLPIDGEGIPGEVVRADVGGFWVATGAGIIGLEEVQLESKRRLPGAEFIKGARITTGDRF